MLLNHSFLVILLQLHTGLPTIDETSETIAKLLDKTLKDYIKGRTKKPSYFDSFRPTFIIQSHPLWVTIYLFLDYFLYLCL